MAPRQIIGPQPQPLVDAGNHLLSGVMEGVAAAIREAEREASKTARELARAIEDGMLTPAERQRIHQSVGEAAQQAVLASYRQSFRGGVQRSKPGYRAHSDSKWQRYAGGRLYAALADPGFFEATPEGLFFINTTLLNSRAKQWARLNFGAGTRGSGSLPPQQVSFGGLVIGAFGLNEGARPGFEIPTGYFLGEAGSAEFYLAGTGPRARKNELKVTGRRAKRYENVTSDSPGSAYRANVGHHRESAPSGARWVKRKKTGGIRSRNFLDRGVTRIADPQRGVFAQYERALDESIKRGETAIRRRGNNQTFKITPARPRHR